MGPSEPAYRSRLQTTSSCIGKEPFVVSVEEKAWQKTVSGEDQGDERKRTIDEVTKYQGRLQNWVLAGLQDKLRGNLFTA